MKPLNIKQKEMPHWEVYKQSVTNYKQILSTVSISYRELAAKKQTISNPLNPLFYFQLWPWPEAMAKLKGRTRVGHCSLHRISSKIFCC